MKTTTIKCKKCKKEFKHFRHGFPKDYHLRCGWCGQEYIVTEDCTAEKMRIKYYEVNKNA